MRRSGSARAISRPAWRCCRRRSRARRRHRCAGWPTAGSTREQGPPGERPDRRDEGQGQEPADEHRHRGLVPGLQVDDQQLGQVAELADADHREGAEGHAPRRGLGPDLPLTARRPHPPAPLGLLGDEQQVDRTQPERHRDDDLERPVREQGARTVRPPPPAPTWRANAPVEPTQTGNGRPRLPMTMLAIIVLSGSSASATSPKTVAATAEVHLGPGAARGAGPAPRRSGDAGQGRREPVALSLDEGDVDPEPLERLVDAALAGPDRVGRAGTR